MEGKVVTSLPERQKPIAQTSLAWDPLVIKAQEVYPASVLAAEGVPESYGKSIRNRRRRPYYTEDGHLKVSILNSHLNPEDGRRYGDVYFTWQPNDAKEAS